MADVATCSTKKMDNTANTCTAPTYYNPAGRKRREAELERTRRSELDGTTLVEVTKTITTPSVWDKNQKILNTRGMKCPKKHMKEELIM